MLLPTGMHHLHLPAGHIDLHVRSEPTHHRYRVDTPLEFTEQEQFFPKDVLFGAGTVCDVGEFANFRRIDFFDLYWG